MTPNYTLRSRPVLDSVFSRHRPTEGCASEVDFVASLPLEFNRLEMPITPDERPGRPGRAGASAPSGLSMDGQLALQLPRELPSLTIEPEWKNQQRLWGQSFHPMCSYLATFPAGLAHAFIARYTRPGDVVLDPFSGRGTTPLQACAEGRVGAGNDLNPFAHILTAAKVDPPTKSDVKVRLATLRLAWGASSGEWNALADRIVADPGSDLLVPAPGSRPISGTSTERSATGSIPVRADASLSTEVAQIGRAHV